MKEKKKIEGESERERERLCMPLIKARRTRNHAAPPVYTADNCSCCHFEGIIQGNTRVIN